MHHCSGRECFFLGHGGTRAHLQIKATSEHRIRIWDLEEVSHSASNLNKKYNKKEIQDCSTNFSFLGQSHDLYVKPELSAT